MAFRNEEEDELFKMGPGTPSGELFRRYWLPVETSANLGGGRGPVTPSAKNPVRLKVLDETLVLFRDATGKPGLLEEHCTHRGTSLAYGRVENDGLRCLYHGWKYDREGNCLDMPAETNDRFRASVKHPAYPCVEVGGLIFAYMGPPELQPPFPQYPVLFRKDGLRVAGKGNRIQKSNALLQTLDNVLDVWHREVAHGWFKGVEPVYGIHNGRESDAATPIKFETTPWGACYVTLQNTRDPKLYEYHETHAVFPCQRSRTDTMNWAVPMDDHTTRWLGVSFTPFDEHGQVSEAAMRRLHADTPLDSGGPFYEGWMEDVGHWWNTGHPLRQGPIWEDEVVMSTQGREQRDGLPDFDKMTFGSSDKGVLLMHKLWKEQIARIQDGADPVGIVRGPEAEQMIPLPGQVKYVDRQEGDRLFNMTLEERMNAQAEELRLR